jgi:hypothetical protein
MRSELPVEKGSDWTVQIPVQWLLPSPVGKMYFTGWTVSNICPPPLSSNRNSIRSEQLEGRQDDMVAAKYQHHKTLTSVSCIHHIPKHNNHANHNTHINHKQQITIQ